MGECHQATRYNGVRDASFFQAAAPPASVATPAGAHGRVHRERGPAVRGGVRPESPRAATRVTDGLGRSP